MKDQQARESFKKSKNTTISWMIAASYAYYILDRPILSDSVFDGMCKYVYDHWDELEHQHKHLFTREDAQNGSLYALTMMDYPNIVKNTVEIMLNEE